jgi:hypothetical protein
MNETRWVEGPTAGCPAWLAELWVLAGREPPEDPGDGLAELRQWLGQMRRQLSDAEQRLEAFARRRPREEKQPADPEERTEVA